MAREFIAPIAPEAPYKATRKAWVPPQATIAGRNYGPGDGAPCPVWTQPGEAYCRKHRP